MPAQKKPVRNQTHSFTLLLDQVRSLSEEQVTRIYARCPDAMVSERDGAVHVAFDRDEKDFARAVTRAIRDLQQLGFTIARLAADDVVGLSDMARRWRKSREFIRLLVQGERGPGGFPVPAYNVGRQHLWHLADVERWWAVYSGRPAVIPDHAAFVAAVNSVLEARRQVARMRPAEVRAVRQLAREEQLVSA